MKSYISCFFLLLSCSLLFSCARDTGIPKGGFPAGHELNPIELPQPQCSSEDEHCRNDVEIINNEMK